MPFHDRRKNYRKLIIILAGYKPFVWGDVLERTKRNCITLALNKTLILHPDAEYIYKIDEDIFITEHLFDVLMKTYEQVKADGVYEAGFVAPLIPVNVYGHTRILDKLCLLNVYEQKFGRTGLLPFQNLDVWKNPEAAKFFWGEGDIVPLLDDMAEKILHRRLLLPCMSYQVQCWVYAV